MMIYREKESSAWLNVLEAKNVFEVIVKLPKPLGT